MTPTPKPISQLSIFSLNFPDPEVAVRLTAAVPERDALKHADLEDNLRSIVRRFERLPLRDRSMDLYGAGRIILLGNRETVKVPRLLPAWRSPARGVSAFVNAVPYVPASGAANMDVRKLFGLLSIGVALVDTYAQWGKITASGAVAKSGSMV